jgi:hypothetical protein
MEYNEETNLVTFEITDPGAYSCYQMFNQSGDFRNLDRSDQSRELKDLMINNTKHSQIAVKYGESYSYVKNQK